MNLYPSLMACPIFELKSYVQHALSLGVHTFHIDIMDRNYVPADAMSSCVIKELLELDNQIHLQVHLMVNYPEPIVLSHQDAGSRIDFYIHSDQQNAKSLLKHENVYPTWNIWQPETYIESTKTLAMSVPIGLCGQKKSFSLKKVLQKSDFSNQEVTLDGGLKLEDVDDIKLSSIHSIVVGSGIFSQEASALVMTEMFLKSLSDHH